MNEANLNLADRLTADEGEPPLAPRNHGGVDELATTRLPPVPHPPHLPSSRPPSNAPSSLAPILPPVEANAAGASPFRPPPHTSTSWWRSLLASTSPPPTAGMGSVLNASTSVPAHRFAAVCGAVAAGLFVVALIVGLWGAPSQIFMPPIVSAAIVIARALVGLGLLGFSVALLRMGERALFRASNEAGELKRGP